ncbi:uncharacterized protein YukE [Nocardia transvalensis]|uniref:Uncharacterized protein YukE n=1 Tax=Nocardia transvalensis TaxID=37333 RepID=A0A7W9PN47_9NOCA|nr:WXG100 family type VII secretion target [Nocardia transvalensis]MBB5918719.1 uncharacterized protein YukE [Nocardia transvalensis]
MGQSLHVDPDELRNAADELRALADETARVVAELKADLAREGECWGDDEPGKMIAESYVPGADQGMAGFENLVQNIDATSSNLRSTAETFETQDRNAGNGIRNSTPDAGAPATTYPSPTNQANSGSTPDQRSPGAGQTPEQSGQSGTGSPTPGDAAANAQQPAAQQQQPAAQRPADSSDGSDSPGDDSGNNPDSSAPNATGSDSPGGGSDHNPSQPGTSGPNPTAASTPPTSPSAPSFPGAGGGAGATATPSSRPKSPSKAYGPAAQQNSGAPSPKSGTGTPSEQQSPPRPAQPRRPAAQKPSPAPEKRKNPTRKPPPRPLTDDEAMRIVTAMAVRHNLQIIGFEAAAISVPTAQEIADAVDSVLGKYSIALHGIEIADIASALSGVENRAEPTAPEPEPWIVLERRAVADPGARSERDRVRALPAEKIPRQVYARMLREFGRVIDMVGGLRARRTVQRALITEYLRVTGADRRTLAHVTNGYRRWRSQLGDGCFSDGVIEPGSALADAFATVEQGGVQAPGPAKVLHRLLLVMARLDMGKANGTPWDSGKG